MGNAILGTGTAADDLKTAEAYTEYLEKNRLNCPRQAFR